jgi:hypothetical protein
MKWLPTNSDARHRIYELRTNREVLATLTYHPQSGTIRISSGDEKRVFLVGREGFIRSRTVLRNEYGIWMGQLIHDGGQNDAQGNIQLSGEAFNYTLQRMSPARAVLYKNNDTLAVCELPDVAKNARGNNDPDLLMLALCWYVSAAVKSREMAYA